MIIACSPGADAKERIRVGRASEGVPLFMKELLASPSVPESISEKVRGRLAELPGHERAVLEAAIMGRRFDWEILPASGQSAEVVSRALARAADRVLVTADAAGFQFRHALTRRQC